MKAARAGEMKNPKTELSIYTQMCDPSNVDLVQKDRCFTDYGLWPYAPRISGGTFSVIMCVKYF
jgi:hypothetical protein